MRHKFGLAALVLLSGFAGGFASNCLLANAQIFEKVVSAKSFQLVNDNGQVIGTWTACGQNAPCLNFYDGGNNVRLQLGLYEAAGEQGLPFVGLMDEKFQMKGLLRLYGRAQAPVLVMKNRGQDRLIMGLDFQDSMDPFLKAVTKDGGTKSFLAD